MNNTDSIKPVLLDITKSFSVSNASGWVEEYELTLGDDLIRKFHLRSLKRTPEALGYRFYAYAKSAGFKPSDDQIDEKNINKALTLDQPDKMALEKYLTEKINSIGTTSWDKLEDQLDKFMDASDITEDHLDYSQGNDA